MLSGREEAAERNNIQPLSSRDLDSSGEYQGVLSAVLEERTPS